jgi:hypothetical protein
MKLNTKLGVGKQQDMRLVLDGPLEVVLKQDNTRLDALEGRIATLVDVLSKQAAPPEPEEIKVPVVAIQKPQAYTLDVRRREDGLIKEVKALDAETGLLYYTFDVRRDQFGAVANIAALPREV